MNTNHWLRIVVGVILAIGLVMAFYPVSAQDIEAQNMATTQRFIEDIWASQEMITREDVAEYTTECWVDYDPFERHPFREYVGCTDQGDVTFVNELKKAYPEHVVTIEHLFADGDMVLVHFTWRGVRSSWFGLTQASNEEEQLDFTFLQRFEDGKIVEAWFYWIAPVIYEEMYRNWTTPG